uniref:Uncharacterized protein n=1 Tax=Acrobeloides nanus TaxID=290746 RepID=A0A914BXN4_9BILA
MKNCIIEEFSYLNLKPKEEHSIDALCKNLQTVIKLFGGKIRAIDSHMAVKDHEVFIEKFGDYLMTDRLGLKDADKLIFNPNLLNYYSNSQMYLSCTHKFINDANYHSTPTSEIHSLDEFFNFAIKAGKNCSLAFKQYEQQIPLKIFIEKYFQVVKNSENPSNFAGKIKFNTSNVEYEKFQTKWNMP